MLVEAWTYLVGHPAQFWKAFGVHVSLSLAALAFASAIAIPIGVRLADRKMSALAAINAANIGRTLPSIAVLALAMPLLGTGFLPSVVALTLIALPPILVNTITGVREIDPDVIDAARGMSNHEVLRRIKLPLAVPVIFAGLRTSAVQVVSGAVLATFIGGGGLGDFITSGIAMMALPLMLVGAIPVTLLSLGADALFGLLQQTLTPRGLR